MKLYKDKKWLNDQYWNQGKSLRKIAKECEVSAPTIQYYMKKFYILRRKKPFKHSPETKRKISDSLIGNKRGWKGGKTKANGYHIIYKPDHLRANKQGYIAEHILIAEKILGRPLKYYGKSHKNNEIPHHINFIKSDNREENLFVCKNQSEHYKIHWKFGNESKILLKRNIIKFNREKKEYYLNEEKIKKNNKKIPITKLR